MNRAVEPEDESVCIRRVKPDTICISANGSPTQVASLRRQVMDFARLCPLSAEELASVELAVGEACSNAFKYGCLDPEKDHITVRCVRDRHSLLVEVSDPGPGFDPESIPSPIAEDLRESGMGIFLMRTTMDSVDFTFNHGTTVRLGKSWKHR